MQKNGKFLNGQTTPQRAVGFCHYRQHQGYLSVKQLKNHNCLGKQCPYLQKYEDNIFWIRRVEIKELKKAKKLELMAA